ncbi:MAG: MurR/RpiR family transcriptional regulator [Oscillospiraceae bacterium]|nr:MurR/RpiR family transcriptional regulator [Oscillospiraceae bacterium]
MDKDVLAVISTATCKFSKGQKKIAGYIMENYDKAAFMTAGKLGATVGVSESTVVRFASDLGYGGYPVMRKAMQEMIKSRLTSVQRIAVARDLITEDNIPASVLTSDIDKIKHTLQELDHESFDRAVDEIVKAEHIYILGLRSSSALANFMGFYMNLIFPNVHVVNENSSIEIFEQIMRIGKNDVFIAISFPRYSRRTIKAMQFALDNGAEVIGITDNETSLLAQTANIKLYAKSDMVSFLDSLVAPLSLINALIAATASKANGDLAAKFERLENIWEAYDVYEKNIR